MSTTDLSSATWRKSSRSNGQANCVEVADLDGGRRAIRDSKNPRGPALIIPPPPGSPSPPPSAPETSDPARIQRAQRGKRHPDKPALLDRVVDLSLTRAVKWSLLAVRRSKSSHLTSKRPIGHHLHRRAAGCSVSPRRV
ncbi:MAG: DUF397 domain-containing protein [Pseudonocardiaceae bacterium]